MDETIVSNLILREAYARRVLPFLSPEYFTGTQKELFELVAGHYVKYNTPPTKEALRVLADEPSSANEEQQKRLVAAIDAAKVEESTDLEFLVDKTELFCQDRAVENALRKSILVLDGKEKTLDKGSIPKLLSDALAVSFNTNIGLNVLEDGEAIWERYQAVENKIAFDLEYLNDIFKGGVSKKSLTVFLAGVNVGKSMVMCHLAAAATMLGRTVLYITLEMAEDQITQRVHGNMMDVTVDDVKKLDKTSFMHRLDRVKSRTAGKFIVKEYPTSQAGSSHFRYLLNELKLKQKFVPDVVFVDYLNLCASSRIKQGSTVNSYTYIKAIAEELRGLAVEFDFALITATQVTRGGFDSSDFDMTDTSESFGLPATADAMIGVIRTEELDELGQLMFKQLKNRWGDVNHKKRFVIGVDMAKMKLFDAEKSAQDSIMKDSRREKKDDVPKKKRGNFEGFDDE